MGDVTSVCTGSRGGGRSRGYCREAIVRGDTRAAQQRYESGCRKQRAESAGNSPVQLCSRTRDSSLILALTLIYGFYAIPQDFRITCRRIYSVSMSLETKQALDI